MKRVECPHCGASASSAKPGSAWDMDVATELEGWHGRLCSSCSKRYWVRAKPDGTFDVDGSIEKPTD